ncbi:DUF1642 domain-containing protein [Streptococcus anginosus]|uniref:DUF1642 domain-containing protein n=1 Tax=Streptococcus anginosus TaxID=1328 RepID=A0A6G4N0D6_STRAP|nr:DUF1642 domain-containing protein [Streptococcus anginosus]MCW0988457.1 DUF1642 domain-containing protein [Streptococcus anginosus]MCW1037017.1 DUF1642 domain-containing protein [Streptococcus anginosus]NGG16707.1 DUF1642 domain-containing protein [Streptococcus anginosus]NGG24032.1 DUF1642 domain-containing protein [Streptococcus anginosus]
MKYKLGDEVYLKGVITSINSCAEIKYLYEVKTADEFVTAAERHLEPINKEEAPLCLRNVLARLRGLPEHDREAWLKGIMDEFELDFSHAKWREGYEQGKFDGAVEAEKSNKVVIPQFVADCIIARKGVGDTLIQAMEFYDELNNIKEYDWISDNSELFARAWLDGYDVEQEKRYEVKLKNTSDYLVKTNNDDYHFYNNIYIQNRKHTRKELEDAGFGWVFDCEGVEVQEVE